ncbi:MAG: hypothetical protein U0Q16_03035 [Bryobacteraceae bacterium]
MLGKTSVKLNKSLCQRAAKCAEQLGYSSLEEFVEHVLERAVSGAENSDSADEVEKKLKGLGYLA